MRSETSDDRQVNVVWKNPRRFVGNGFIRSAASDDRKALLDGIP